MSLLICRCVRDNLQLSMEMNKKNRHHQFYLPWYAGDEHTESWISYLHRNLHHIEGENEPFSDSEWHFNHEDAELHDEVLDTLYESEKVDASLITVVVINRSVSLYGVVDSPEQKRQAEIVVKGIDSVWSVRNELVVRATDAQYLFSKSRS